VSARVRRRRAHCRYCPRRIAITRNGRVWPHGSPQCRGSGRAPATFDYAPTEPYWPTWHHGRRVTTVPGPDTWNPKETAA
jgi:hypothetical protein